MVAGEAAQLRAVVHGGWRFRLKDVWTAARGFLESIMTSNCLEEWAAG